MTQQIGGIPKLFLQYSRSVRTHSLKLLYFSNHCQFLFTRFVYETKISFLEMLSSENYDISAVKKVSNIGKTQRTEEASNKC